MDLNNETVREIALTVAGHLATAGVAYLLASIRMDRRLAKHLRGIVTASVATRVPAFVSEIVPENVPQLSDSRGKAVADAIAAVRKSEIERDTSKFVRLDEAGGAGDHRLAHSSQGRNRTEIIRLAKKMLEAGNSPDRVADLLPLTESELQMARLGSASN